MSRKYVLLLNKYFVAVQMVHWKRAISLLYSGGAKAVDSNYMTYDFGTWMGSKAFTDYGADEFVHTVNLCIPIPRVIVALGYEKVPNPPVKLTRYNVFDRDSYQCQYCGAAKPDNMSIRDWANCLTIDHVVPKACGGKHTWSNVVCACMSCNNKKADKPLPELPEMQLLHKPRIPKWRPTVKDGEALVSKYSEWKSFLGIYAA